ncbi:hypothetical protein [Azonexus sp.]|uniref:hypothetical protein n=1 Tax=Azonexus sp. TaxID=1872668 RepID=UPI0035AEF70A
MNTENSLNMAVIRNEIQSKRQELAQEQEYGKSLIGTAQEIRNWLAGHPLDSESKSRDGRYLTMVRSKNQELETILGRIKKSEQRCSLLEDALQKLEAIKFSEAKAMDLAMDDHRQAARELQALSAQETSMKAEQGKAEQALDAARFALSKAQAAKKNALSMQDVSKASENEVQAQRKVDELLALVTNLKNALAPIPGKQAAKKLDLATAEATVWKARFSLLMHDLVSSTHFQQFAEMLEEAFASWVKAGNVFSPERFLNEALNGKTLVNFDPEHIETRQSNAAEEMGLDNAFAQ